LTYFLCRLEEAVQAETLLRDLYPARGVVVLAVFTTQAAVLARWATLAEQEDRQQTLVLRVAAALAQEGLVKACHQQQEGPEDFRQPFRDFLSRILFQVADQALEDHRGFL
jgi:hypothetical protein